MLKNVKKLTSILVLSAMLLSMLPFAASAADIVTGNLLTNGGFENGVTGWDKLTEDNIYSGDAANIYEGAYSAYLPEGSNYSKFLGTVGKFQVERPYIASYMAKAASGTPTTMLALGGLSQSDGVVPFNSIEASQPALNTSTWTDVHYTFYVPSGVSSSTLYTLSWSGLTDPIYIDNFYIGQLLIGDLKYTGDSLNVSVPESGSVEINLSAEAYNQLGTKAGLYTAEQTGSDATYSISWSLADNYEGVTLEGSKLTIAAGVSVPRIRIQATGLLTYPGVPVSNQTKYTKTFTIELQNMLSNGGFENGLTDWPESDKVTLYSKNPANVYSGNYSAYLNGASYNNISRWFDVYGGVPYIASYMAKAESGDQAVMLALKDLTDGTSGHTVPFIKSLERTSATATSSGWTNLFYTFCPSKRIQTEIYMSAWAPITNPIFVDDILVEELVIADLELTAGASLTAPAPGQADIKIPLSATAYNQLGTTGGLYTAEQTGADATYVVSLALAEDYEGVSVDGTNLVISDDIDVSEISLKATATLTYPGVPEDKQTTYEETFAVSVRKPGDNIAVNGGFENGLSNWPASSNVTVNTDAANVYDGNASAYLAKGAKYTDFVQAMDVKAGKAYIATYKAKAATSATTKAMMVLENLDSADVAPFYKTLEPQSVTLNTSEWLDVFQTFVPKKSFATKTFLIGWGVGEPMYIDNIYLSELLIGDLKYTGSTTFVNAPVSGDAAATLALSAEPFNQLGTKQGLYTAEQTGSNATYEITWALADSYTGVSLNGSTLTVSPGAVATEVQVEATATLTYPGVSAENQTSYKETFTIDIIPATSISEYQVNGGDAADAVLTEGGNLTVTSTFRSREDAAAGDMMLLAALYDATGTKLIAAGSDIKAVTTAGATMSASMTLPEQLDAGNYILKVYAWDASYRPIAFSTSYTLSK